MCNSHTTLLPRWLILLLVHFSANLESTSGASSSPGSGPSFTIKVLDLDSRPVEGAVVLIPDHSLRELSSQPSVHSWKTDASGTASVSLVGNMLSQHAVAFWIRHSNHAPAQMILSSNPKPLGKLQIPSQTVQLRKGITVGGVVLDPGGKAVPNAKIEVWGQDKTPERSDKGDGFSVLIGHSLNRHSGLHVTTDSNGRWVMHQFPKDVSEVYLDIIRPDGGFGLFSPVSASALFGVRTAGSFSSEDLRNTNAILRFPKGETVRGRVLDWQGQPRAGARIIEFVGGFSARQTWETQSDAKGEFELKDRSHDLGIVMVEAEGAAAASARFVLPGQAAKTLEIQLHPQSPLKLQLLGTNGLPLAGAQVVHAEHRSKVAIPWSATADAQGRVEWIAAPASVLALSVFAPHHAFRTFRVKPDGSLKSLQLPAELDRNVRIKVKAIEAASSKPVQGFSIFRTDGYHAVQLGESQNASDIDLLLNQDAPPLQGLPQFSIEIRAPGFSPWRSDWVYTDEGVIELEAKLDRLVVIKAKALLPGGQPAMGVQLLMNSPEPRMPLYSHTPRIFQSRPDTERATTLADGSFNLPMQSPDQRIIAVHAEGFADVRAGDVVQSGRIQLMRWGSVSGVFHLEGKPAPDQSLSLRSPPNGNAPEGFQIMYQARTDKLGRYSFTNLPPGTYERSHNAFPVMGSPSVESGASRFDLVAGENKLLPPPPRGRAVVGKLNSDPEIDWKNDAHRIDLDVGPQPGPPVVDPFLSPGEQQAVWTQHARSPEMLEYLAKARSHQLIFGDDGEFRIPDVQPGRYRFQVNPTRPPAEGKERDWNAPQIARLEKTIEVPPGEGVLNLGELWVDYLSDAPSEIPQLLKLSLNSLASPEIITVEQLRGKPLVIAFWAEWASGSSNLLTGIDAIRTNVPAASGYQWLSVNLGDEPKAIRHHLPPLAGNWTHGRLGGERLISTAAELELKSLPIAFLVDAEGRLLHREAKSQAVERAIQRIARRQVAKNSKPQAKP